MAQRVRDILLRIRGDASDAENDLHQLARELKQFDAITAEATVDINTTAAERKVKSAKDAVQAFGRMSEQAKVDLQTQAAETKLTQLRTNLERLQARPTEPKIDIAIGRTVAQIERVEAQLDKLDRRRVDIDIDVDRGGRGRLGAAGGVAGLAVAGAVGLAAGAKVLSSGFEVASQGVISFVSAASSGIPVLGALASGMASLGLSAVAIVPIMLILVAVIGGAMVTAVTLLAGAIVALGASFLAAAAGVGVLVGALAAAFGPVLLVAIAAMARFAKILEAVKQAEDGTTQSAQQATTSLRAQAAAAEAVDDAIRGIAQAELSREQASLNVKQAEQALRDFRKEAGLAGAEFDDMFKKFTDVDFRPKDLIGAIQKSGLGKATAPGDQLTEQQLILNVRQARLGEQAAIDGVSDAHERLADARRDQTDALKKQNTALDKQNDKLDGLTDKEKELVDVIVALKEALTSAFRPATQRIFDGLIDFLKDVGDFAKDRRVQGGLKDIGDAIGDMFRAFGRELRRPQTREAFATFARAGATIIRTLTPVFRVLSRLVLNVAQEAMPWLLDVIRRISRSIRNWVGDIDRSDIEDFVKRIRRSFNIWIGIAKELWGIIKAFFSDANEKGDTLAEHLRKILGRFRGWLDENPQAVEDFFERAVTFAMDLASAMERIATAMEKIVDLAQDVKDVGTFVTGGSISGQAEAEGSERTNIAQLRLLIKRSRGARKRYLIRLLKDTYGVAYATGGPVFGAGIGDTVPAMLTPGEYVLNRSVAQAIGVPKLNMLNAGNLAAFSAGGRAVTIENQTVVLPPAPGHDQMGDARHQAVQFARELRRRGGQGIGGGGIG